MAAALPFDAFFTDYEQIGKGAFGSVYRALIRSYAPIRAPKDVTVAVKLIDISRLDLEITELDREIEVLRQAMRSYDAKCSPYVVCYFDQLDVIKDNVKYRAIITEFIDGNTLEEFINRLNEIARENFTTYKMNSNDLVTAMDHLSRGLAYLHSIDLVHRDIKPANIMYNSQGQFKYVDFGFACSLKRTAKLITRCSFSRKGSPNFVAPEVWLYFNKTKVGRVDTEDDIAMFKAADVWALGVTFYMLAIGDLPWESDTLDDVRDEITDMSRRDIFTSNQLRNFQGDKNILSIINSMLNPHYKQRITATEVNDAVMSL